jgi:pyrroloquinoline quinone biosynthesis protein D
MNSFDPLLRPVLAPHVRLSIDPLTGDPVLLYPEGFLVLNGTAHEIVRRCNGETTVAALLQHLGEEFDAGEEILRHDLLENLEQLRRRNLLLFTT